ncbi:SURF1 family cytochrome oxidase biogenesis protein [uncultured Sphingomonas sp.]|jgi:surfeit locus 1 family protein|uniref:SURF1 family cytochrome oxidase biogenesis protein n=1 Tax=unclassified Sphingomonas TaxID=196159 RepID=UPI0025E16C66|nr:SURF1 family cytochrome oxidase biogenesis protein [uncultured Sphingomonas sp.]
MRRVPILPTILVALAVAMMIGLGLWQLLIRLPQKEAQLAQLAANPSRPPIAFPMTPDDSLLFRRSTLDCGKVTAITRAGAGAAGYRLIAQCLTPNGVAKVQLGTTHDPVKEVSWVGGPVSGWISHAPDATPLGAQLFKPAPRELLLVADRPADGLAANSRPNVSLVPNNHLAYAGQWFFFAAVAAVIYVLALRRRGRPAGPPRRER